MAAQRCALLAYEPGGGKTPTALVAASLAPPGPVVVVTLRNALQQWEAEAKKWTPTRNEIIFTTYERVGQIAIRYAHAVVVLLDEIHEARTADTATWRALYPLCCWPSPTGAGRRVYGLTGTPVWNSVSDLAAQLVLLGLLNVSEYPKFLWRYCNPKLGGIATGPVDFRGVDRIPELRALIAPVLIRRTYAELGQAMPPVSMRDVPVDLSSTEMGQEYQRAAADFTAWYRDTHGREVPSLAKFTVQRRLLSLAKVPSVAAQLRRELATSHNFLVFTEFRDTAETLHKQFKGSGLVLGGQGEAPRLDVFERGRDGSTGHIVFATHDSLGAAVNLQQFTRVYLVDLVWTPAEFDQVLKRAWRNLQQHPVSVLRFFVPFDELENLLVEKLLTKDDTLAQLGLQPTGSVTQLGLRRR